MSTLSTIRAPIGIVTVSMFLNFAGFTLIIPVMPFLVGRYVDPDLIGATAAIITAVYAVGQFIAAQVLGALSDRLGRRPVLLLSLLGSVAGYLVFGLGGALWVLFLGRIIDGLTGGNTSTLYAYVADVTPPRERGRYYGVLGAAGGLGFIIGPAVGGLAGELSLSAPVFIAAAVTFGNVLWAYFALPESLAPSARARVFDWRHLSPLSTFSDVFSSTTLRIAFAASFLFYFAGTMLQSNLAVFLKDIVSFGPAGIGGILLIVGLMDIVSQGFLSGRLLPTFGDCNLARVGLLINGLGFLMIALVAFVASGGLIYAAIVVFTLGDGLFQPSMGGIIANAAPAGAQGRIQGANQGQQSIARIVGPLLAAFLYTLGPSAPYLAGSAVVLFGLAIIFVYLE